MIDVAKRAAILAGRKIVFLRRKGLTFKSKERLGDIVTDADTASERIILELLKKQFPNHNFISEEVGKIDNGSEYTWIIDPLDGTIPYSSGLPIFAVSIGLLRNFQPQLGVVNMPDAGWLFWAEAGKGAYVNGERIKVSSKEDLMKCVVGFDVAYIGTRRDEIERRLLPLADRVRYPLMLGCASANGVYVARGILDAYLHSAYPWDYAAAFLIVTEAGGKVTDYSGRPIDWSKDRIDFFASNGLIHDEILSLIKQ